MSKYYTTAGMVLVALMVCAGPAWGLSVTPQSASTQPAAASSDDEGGIGHVKGSNVYVRSGFAQNYYPVLKLHSGDKVTILRNKFGWLEILPPAGAYSLVEKTRIDKTNDGVGTANDQVQVYAGSDLDNQKYAKQVKLRMGDSVKIIGETAEGDFYKITPPEGATLWIRADMVNRGDKAGNKIEIVKQGELGKPPMEEGKAAAAPGKKPMIPLAPARKVDPVADEANRETIRIIEAEIAAETMKPAAEQVLAPIIEKLTPLAEQSDDTVTQTWAKARLDSVRVQTEFASALQEMSKLKENAIIEANEIQRRRAEMKAKRDQWEVNPVVARGEIRASGLYTGSGGQPRRWRLVDTKSGSDRTIAYLEVAPGSAIDPVQFYGQFVGIEATSYQLLHGSVPPLPVYLVQNIKTMDPNAPLEPIIHREAIASPARPSTQPAREMPAATQPALESSPRPETITEKPMANQPTLKSSAHPD